jgi:hypothetical protein
MNVQGERGKQGSEYLLLPHLLVCWVSSRQENAGAENELLHTHRKTAVSHW